VEAMIEAIWNGTTRMVAICCGAVGPIVMAVWRGRNPW
jgi:hypothetical protein